MLTQEESAAFKTALVTGMTAAIIAAVDSVTETPSPTPPVEPTLVIQLSSPAPQTFFMPLRIDTVGSSVGDYGSLNYGARIVDANGGQVYNAWEAAGDLNPHVIDLAAINGVGLAAGTYAVIPFAKQQPSGLYFEGSPVLFSVSFVGDEETGHLELVI